MQCDVNIVVVYFKKKHMRGMLSSKPFPFYMAFPSPGSRLGDPIGPHMKPRTGLESTLVFTNNKKTHRKSWLVLPGAAAKKITWNPNGTPKKWTVKMIFP